MQAKSNRSAVSTTSGDTPVPDNRNSITAGPRDPLLMQGYQIIAGLAHDDMPLARTFSLILTRAPRWTESLD